MYKYLLIIIIVSTFNQINNESSMDDKYVLLKYKCIA